MLATVATIAPKNQSRFGKSSSGQGQARSARAGTGGEGAPAVSIGPFSFPRRAFLMLSAVEGSFGFPLGGDPEDLLRGLREFAEQQAESVQEAQREQFATLTLNTAVELTAAALGQLQATGSSDEQAIALRDAMRVLFPEAVALVSAARQGFMRER